MRWAGAGCLVLVIGAAAAGPAGAAAARASGTPATCTGTKKLPGHLFGTYPNGVLVSGYCDVNDGAAVVDGDLTVGAGATVDATFANNDVKGTGRSSLTVTGDLVVGAGATLVMGCEPVHMGCSDDPNGTLTGSDHIDGSLIATDALGVVVHAATFGGSVTQTWGGGGVTPASGGAPATCIKTPPGLFAAMGNGVFSDYEDNTIGGNLRIAHVQTCWIGALRNTVTGDMTDSHNLFSDPDANEALANAVGGNIKCKGNSPAVQYGDSLASPNVVSGSASGECSFTLSVGTPVSVPA
jgi:hypothetical protein